MGASTRDNFVEHVTLGIESGTHGKKKVSHTSELSTCGACSAIATAADWECKVLPTAHKISNMPNMFDGHTWEK